MAKPNVQQISSKEIPTTSEVTGGSEPTTQSDAFEMIELAISDIELLTKAFSLISDICAEEQDKIDTEGSEPRILH